MCIQRITIAFFLIAALPLLWGCETKDVYLGAASTESDTNELLPADTHTDDTDSIATDVSSDALSPTDSDSPDDSDDEEIETEEEEEDDDDELDETDESSDSEDDSELDSEE